MKLKLKKKVLYNLITSAYNHSKFPKEEVKIFHKFPEFRHLFISLSELNLSAPIVSGLLTWYLCSCSVISSICRSYSAIRGAIILQHRCKMSLVKDCIYSSGGFIWTEGCLCCHKHISLLHMKKLGWPSVWHPGCWRLSLPCLLNLMNIKHTEGEASCNAVPSGYWRY